MGRRRSAWLGLAGWLVAGCTYTPYPAESTAAACVNDEDDDRDGRMNCDDPDCWRFAYCQPRYDSGVAGGPAMPPVEPPMMPDDPLVPMDNQSMTDGSMPITQDARVPDAEADADVDADLPEVCSEYCPPGQCNEDGSCMKPLVFGKFDVQSIRLAAPRANNNVCFDLRPVCTWVLGATCCTPDPIVTLYVGDIKAGFVWIADDEAPIWETVDMQIELREGDQIKFEVEDEDTFAVGDDMERDSPQAMFTCEASVTAAMIEAGTLGCVPEGSFQPVDEYFVVASITRLGDVDVGSDEGADAPGSMP